MSSSYPGGNFGGNQLLALTPVGRAAGFFKEKPGRRFFRPLASPLSPATHTNTQANGRANGWKCRASIPVPVACEATALPFELHSQGACAQLFHVWACVNGKIRSKQQKNYLLPPIPTGSQRARCATRVLHVSPLAGGTDCTLGLRLPGGVATHRHPVSELHACVCRQEHATRLAADIPSPAACHHAPGLSSGCRARLSARRRYTRVCRGFPAL